MSEANAKTIEMGSTKWTYLKERYHQELYIFENFVSL